MAIGEKGKVSTSLYHFRNIVESLCFGLLDMAGLSTPLVGIGTVIYVQLAETELFRLESH